MANNTGTFFNINDNDGIPLVGVSTDGKVMINHLYGNCLIGSTSATGTASQPLQVTGGAYVSGNLGIGTTSPAEIFHVNAPSNALAVIRLSGSASSQTPFNIRQGIVGTSNAGFSIYDVNNSATRFAIDSSGNLGIGTNSPGSKLQVIGGDIRVGIDTSQGIILTSQNGTKYRLIVSNAGVLSTVSVP